MMENNIIQDKMDNKEVNCNEVKKVWIAPELEVLDGRYTYGGNLSGMDELDYIGEEHGDAS